MRYKSVVNSTMTHKESIQQGSSYKNILKYTGIFGSVQLITILVGLVRNKLVAVLLGREGMGFISLLNSTIKLISDSSNLGVSFSAIRQVSNYYDHDESKMLHFIKVTRSWSLMTGLLGAFICIVLAPWLSKWTFNWGDHTLHFIFLAPVVFLTAITGGELAILKGTRHLKALAQISIINVIGAVIISVPLFYYFDQTGIVPSLNLVALFAAIVTVAYSYKYYPLRKDGEKFFADGLEMLKIGIFFTLAGIGGSLAEMLIRTYLNNVADLGMVGAYNAGFMIVVTYAGMVFAAMETDYFPRLSAVHQDYEEMNRTINHQIEVSLLIVAPLLVGLIIFLPFLIPLLFSGEFIDVVPMAQVAILAMFFHAVDLPIEYVPLAKGDSITYLIIELIYDAIFVFLIAFGYQYLGLLGTGIALAVAHFVNCTMVVVYFSWRYKIRLSHRVVIIFSISLLMGLLAYFFTLTSDGYQYWMQGCVLLVISTLVSLLFYRKYAK